MTRASQKKEEIFYLEKFLEGIECKPQYIDADRERPDIIISIEGERIGIEVTNFHILPDKNQNFTRRQVEEAWLELQDKINLGRNHYKELHDISGYLSFKELKVPPRSKHNQFVKEIIAFALSKLPLLENSKDKSSDFSPKYPLLNEYLTSFSSNNIGCYTSWDWNHNAAWVGLSEYALINILEEKKEKLKKYETKNIKEMWLLLVSGYKISQAMGVVFAENLNGYTKCDALLKQSEFERAYIYQYMEGRIIEWSGHWRVIKEKKR